MANALKRQAGAVHRGNIVPPGGVTPNVVGGVVAGGMIMPDTVQLQELADLFMENSEQNYLMMNRVPLTPGATEQFNLQTVGLGEGLELLVSGTFNIRNAHTAVQVVALPPDFPYNLLRGVTIIFNGQATLVQASGYELLAMMLKRHIKSNFIRSAGGPAALDGRIASVSVTGGTLVAGAPSLTGFTGISIAAGAVATITIRFYLDISFVLRKDLLLGLLPMANTSVHANVQLMVSPLVGTSPEFPINSSGLTLITAEVPVLTCQPTYKFWGLPAQRQLYEHLVNTSYIVTKYANLPITTTGERAIAFEVPINFWLVSALMVVRNAGRTLVDVFSTLDRAHLVYNGTIMVDMSDMVTRVARDFVHQGFEMPLGQLLFDYTQTGNLWSNSGNTSRWLNMYQASNPMLHANVATGVTVPGTFDVVLERIAPNHVQVI